jgi:hypothetical protein
MAQVLLDEVNRGTTVQGMTGMGMPHPVRGYGLLEPSGLGDLDHHPSDVPLPQRLSRP